MRGGNAQLLQCEAARASLAEQLRTEKRTVEKQQHEIESLQLTQKFLGRGADAKIPNDKMDLMKMVDRLASDVRLRVCHCGIRWLGEWDVAWWFVVCDNDG